MTQNEGAPTESEKLASDLAKHWERVSDTFTGWASQHAEVSGAAERLTYSEWIGTTGEIAGRMAALWVEGMTLVADHTARRASKAAREALKDNLGGGEDNS